MAKKKYKKELGKLGGLIQKIRESRKDTNKSELARKANLKYFSLSRIERGDQNICFNSLKALADALDVELTISFKRKPGTEDKWETKEKAGEFTKTF